MWHKHLSRWIGLVLLVTLTLVPGGARAGGGDILHTQTDQGAGLPVSSTDFAGSLNVQDNQVADDFTLNCGSSCQIDTILVGGSYQGIAPGSQPSSVRVQFYADPETGIPGDLVSESIIPRANVGGIDSGDYLINLSPSLVLGGGTWWISVQAINTQPNSFYTWTWNERVLAAPSRYPSAWQNPGQGYGKCFTWAPRLATCAYPSLSGHAPDQIFELTGNSSTGTNPVPRINRLVPFYVLPGSGDFTLTLRGHSFVPSSQVRWNGAPITTTTSYIGNSELQVSVLANMVANRKLVSITVFNPGPGGGTSNTRIFLVGTPVFFPITRR